MKVLSQKIGRSRTGAFRGKTHCDVESLGSDSMRLRGNPASLELRAEFEGREFWIRIDALETARIADLMAQLKKPTAQPAAPGADAVATNDG